ncbi:hypothetical protein JCM8097_006415 [Rhodosporidiobolus ruineniae]
MHPSTPEKKLLPAFSLNQHRRRVSLPTTPPETPLDGYFGNDARKSVSLASGNSIFPASPPPTPTRPLPEKEKTLLPPPSGHRSRPSRAYARHRRTSTATLLRLAAARQGIILTPSKAITLFLIIFSATYLASFLPGPLSYILPRPRHAVQPVAYANPSSVVYVHNNVPHRGSQIGDTAQRRAWAESFPFRIPPQQHVVPVKDIPDAAEPQASSLDGDIMREHPELLQNQHRPAQRRPLRLPKEKVAAVVPPPRPSADDSFDDASRSPRQAAQGKGRTAQLQRMKKIAAAKGQNARVGKHVPIDSSEQQAAARAEQERVIVDDGSSTGRRRLRNAKGVEAAVAAAVQERRAAQLAAGQGRKHAPAVAEEEKVEEQEAVEAAVSAPASARSLQVDEDWTGADRADEGDE